MKYIELPCELITSPVLHDLANKCPNLAYMTLDFANAMQLHDFNDLNAFPCNLRSLCICLSEVIFLEGFMRRIYSCLSSLEVLHLIGKRRVNTPQNTDTNFGILITNGISSNSLLVQSFLLIFIKNYPFQEEFFIRKNDCPLHSTFVQPLKCKKWVEGEDKL